MLEAVAARGVYEKEHAEMQQAPALRTWALHSLSRPPAYVIRGSLYEMQRAKGTEMTPTSTSMPTGDR
jgi:hypothetical protein